MVKKILLQHIRFDWDKSFRGAVSIPKKNMMKEGFILPNEILDKAKDKEIAMHFVGFIWRGSFKKLSFEKRFEKMFYKRIRFDTTKCGCLLFKLNNSCLDVYFEYNKGCGAPPLYMYDTKLKKKVPLRKKAFTLKLNEYGRLIFNGRFSCVDTGQWWYERNIFNIIHTDMPKVDIFMKKQVSKKYSQISKLW